MNTASSVRVETRGVETCAEAHHLPCGVVGYSGRLANLHNYFKPTPIHENANMAHGNAKAEDGHEAVKRSEVSLRGRRLVGEEVAMPDGFEMALIRKGAAVNADGSGIADGTGYALAARVSTLHRYNHDMPPSATDGMARAMQYIGMAEALHGKAGQVSEEDVRDAAQKLGLDLEKDKRPSSDLPRNS